MFLSLEQTVTNEELMNAFYNLLLFNNKRRFKAIGLWAVANNIIRNKTVLKPKKQ